MRKYLFCLLAIFAITFVACEPVEPNTPNNTDEATKLELTSKSPLRINSDGGNFDITYSLTNPISGTSVKTTIVNSAMITAADSSVEGVVTITISENNTDAIREGAVIVSYGALSFINIPFPSHLNRSKTGT